MGKGFAFICKAFFYCYICSPNQKLFNMDYNFKEEIIGIAMEDMVHKLNNVISDGLKRKGFEFDNRNELIDFIKKRCTGIHHEANETVMYFVDAAPFLAIKRQPKTEFKINNENEMKISSIFGTFYYL